MKEKQYSIIYCLNSECPNWNEPTKVEWVNVSNGSEVNPPEWVNPNEDLICDVCGGFCSEIEEGKCEER